MENDSNTISFVRQKGVMEYGDIIKAIRGKANITQAQLIELSKISGPTFRKVEKGEGGRITTLFAILDALEVEVSFTKKIKPDEEKSTASH